MRGEDGGAFALSFLAVGGGALKCRELESYLRRWNHVDVFVIAECLSLKVLCVLIKLLIGIMPFQRLGPHEPPLSF
jgi:hypothetical protein